MRDGSLCCPFCLNKRKREYKYPDLLQPARGQGQNKRGRLLIDGQHRALARYLEEEMKAWAEVSAPRAVKLQHGQGRLNWDATKESGTGGMLLYGWMAGKRNFCDTGAMGDYLREHFNLKSMGELQAEDMRTSSCLKQLVEEENYSLKRQLEHVERGAKRVEVDLQEKLFDKDMEWRKVGEAAVADGTGAWVSCRGNASSTCEVGDDGGIHEGPGRGYVGGNRRGSRRSGGFGKRGIAEFS